MSGSCHMSFPQPEARAKAAIIDPVLAKVKAKGHQTLKEAPVEVLLEAQAEVPVVSVFLQEDGELSDWSKKTGEVEELLVGDCEFESVLWRNGIELMTADQIVEAFDKAGGSSAELKKLYHVSASRPTQAKHGALDYINDQRWAWPTWVLTDLYRDSGKKAYTYLFDQPNPWQASSRAHHAVDLIYLFGGFDLSHNPSADVLGKEVRKRFIAYINGEAPWSQDKTFAFGPLGQSKEIDAEEVGARRRTSVFPRLKGMPVGDMNAAFGGLAAGRISLLN